ncbi:MAG: methyltransferase domain-containing protein [Candidatus Lokiarchaeota archaeon]|nr:methyltransferase domain-containing protein [Candidatus Lokiarchaeota archaeon]
MVSSGKFDDIALAYDHSINWEERLRREIPFIIDTIGNIDGKRILDLACGTGRHIIELERQGAEALGIDSSSNMIEKAREIANRHHSDAEFMVADMRDMKESISDDFDLVLCLGNSLALLPNLATLQQVVSDVHDVLVSEGMFLYQILNFESMDQTGFRFITPKGTKSASGDDLVFFRFFDHIEDSSFSTLVLSVFHKEDEEWQMNLNTTQVLQLNHNIVHEIMNEAGFHDMKLYSTYDGSPFDRTRDRNLIVTVEK